MKTTLNRISKKNKIGNITIKIRGFFLLVFAMATVNAFSQISQSDLTMTGNINGRFFGSDVSSAGDVNGDGYSDIIVGSENNIWYENNVYAYIFFGGPSMDSVADVTLEQNDGSGFGASVSTAGDVNGDGYSDVIVGAVDFQNQSKAYIFLGGLNMNNIADIIMTDSQNSYFGHSVSSAGDVNGDGFSDVIVGAPYNSVTGKAFVYFGGSQMNNVADVILSGRVPEDCFGVDVSSAGDVNGDGYSDVIVGAHEYNLSSGKSYIFLGDPEMNNTADVIMTGDTLNELFGISVSSAGDVNGDGYSDVIIGAKVAFNSTTLPKAYIFLGGSSVDNVADVILVSDKVNNEFGNSVSSAGDMNGDGFEDVVVGSYWPTDGKVYVYNGAPQMDNVVEYTLRQESEFTGFGLSVSGVGDVNGDGLSDLIVGAPRYQNKGKTYIYLSNCCTFNITLDLRFHLQARFPNPDTILVYVASPMTPFEILDSCVFVPHVEGNKFRAFLSMSNVPGNSFYIIVKHRNSIETWSKTPITFNSDTAVYDFTASPEMAYGNNMKLVSTTPSVYAFYSGDVNQDGLIDLTDVITIYNDVKIFASGYLSTDLDGNGYVDLNDISTSFNNSVKFVQVRRP